MFSSTKLPRCCWLCQRSDSHLFSRLVCIYSTTTHLIQVCCGTILWSEALCLPPPTATSIGLSQNSLVRRYTRLSFYGLISPRPGVACSVCKVLFKVLEGMDQFIKSQLLRMNLKCQITLPFTDKKRISPIGEMRASDWCTDLRKSARQWSRYDCKAAYEKNRDRQEFLHVSTYLPRKFRKHDGFTKPFGSVGSPSVTKSQRIENSSRAPGPPWEIWVAIVFGSLARDLRFRTTWTAPSLTNSIDMSNSRLLPKMFAYGIIRDPWPIYKDWRPMVLTRLRSHRKGIVSVQQSQNGKG